MGMWAWEWWQAWPAACLHYPRGLNFPMCFFTDSHASLQRLILTHIMVAGQRPSPISTICLPDHCFMFQSGLHGFPFCSFLCNSSFFVCFNLGYMASFFFCFSCVTVQFCCFGISKAGWASPLRDHAGAYEVWHSRRSANLALLHWQGFPHPSGWDCQAKWLSRSLPHSDPCLERCGKGIAQEQNIPLMPHPHKSIIS